MRSSRRGRATKKCARGLLFFVVFFSYRSSPLFSLSLFTVLLRVYIVLSCGPASLVNPVGLLKEDKVK